MEPGEIIQLVNLAPDLVMQRPRGGCSCTGKTEGVRDIKGEKVEVEDVGSEVGRSGAGGGGADGVIFIASHPSPALPSQPSIYDSKITRHPYHPL